MSLEEIFLSLTTEEGAGSDGAPTPAGSTDSVTVPVEGVAHE